MELIAPLLLTALAVTFLLPWALLLTSPLWATGSGAVALTSSALGRLREVALGDARILVLNGLAGHARQQRRLRRAVSSALRLAPEGTRAKACGCVKPVGAGAYVGVLRLSNASGHYAVRTEGASVGAVVRGFVGDLARHAREFPAQVGAKRIKIPECNPATCPLRKLARRMELAPALI